MSPLATALMNSRIEHSMSRFRAAECAGVSERTWRYYEQGQRSPRKSVVRNIFDRSGISMPSNIAKLLKVARSARVLSITSLKGGVGKSPITVDVAACLVERGSNVAIITHDCCYEDDASNGKHPKAHSDLVVIIIDSACHQSVDSAQRLNVRLLTSKGGRRTPRCYGLVTRNDVGGRSQELEEFCEGLEIPPALVEGLEARRLSSSKFREHILKDIKSLPLTRLMTHLTNAHEVVIDKYNYDQPFMESFSYFDSVLDISPESHAADEIRRLAAELVDYRL